MSAVISDCGKYRYWLEREVPYQDAGIAQTMGVIMINPSTADHTLDDPTIRRLRGFASAYGVTRLCVANLFAMRTPNVTELGMAAAIGMDAIGPDNPFYLNKLFDECKAGRVIVGFGAYSKIPDEYWEVVDTLTNLAKTKGQDLWCWGTNKDGSPKHPLYLPKTAELKKWGGHYYA